MSAEHPHCPCCLLTDEELEAWLPEISKRAAFVTCFDCSKRPVVSDWLEQEHKATVVDWRQQVEEWRHEHGR